MKKLLTFLAISVAAFAVAAGAITPSDVLKKRDQYDKKVVTVAGTVKAFKAKTSKAGNDYLTFNLVSGKDSINVFSHGKLAKPLADGTKVEVKGVFVKEKTVGKMTFKNEVDASGKKGEKPNITVKK